MYRVVPRGLYLVTERRNLEMTFIILPTKLYGDGSDVVHHEEGPTFIEHLASQELCPSAFYLQKWLNEKTEYIYNPRPVISLLEKPLGLLIGSSKNFTGQRNCKEVIIPFILSFNKYLNICFHRA